jgi:hypothetical protein
MAAAYAAAACESVRTAAERRTADAPAIITVTAIIMAAAERKPK